MQSVITRSEAESRIKARQEKRALIATMVMELSLDTPSGMMPEFQSQMTQLLSLHGIRDTIRHQNMTYTDDK